MPEVPFNKVYIDLGGGSLLQSANRTHTQMMSYLIKTPDGKIVMIDGGNNKDGDGQYLYQLLCDNGKHVDKWFITHAHSDHYGALLWMLENIKPFDIVIDELYYNFPPLDWFSIADEGLCYSGVSAFLKAVEAHSFSVSVPVAGECIECGGMSFEILNNCNNYINYNEVNDSSIAIIAHFPRRDVLFLSDLEPAGGCDLISQCGEKKLRCDIVQMAHHGQNALQNDFYKLVQPKICLYTAPDWLWDNDPGTGFDTGIWKTVETRGWMRQLGVQASFPIAFGDYLFI